MKYTVTLGIKNYCWIWITVDRLWKKSSTSLLVTEQQNRYQITEKIKDNKMDIITCDYWKVYEVIVSKAKHIQLKTETFTVKGNNSILGMLGIIQVCFKFTFEHRFDSSFVIH